jgi:hypothetical protein
MSKSVKFYIGSDNRCKITGLHDPAYEVGHASYYVNDATVTMQLKQSDNSTNVSGASATLTYVTSSDGDYAGSFPSTVTLVDDTTYKAHITITRSGQDTLLVLSGKAGYYEGEE